MNGNTIVEPQETALALNLTLPPASNYANGFSKHCSFNGGETLTNGFGSSTHAQEERRIPLNGNDLSAASSDANVHSLTSAGISAPSMTPYDGQQAWPYILDCFMNKRWLEESNNGIRSDMSPVISNREQTVLHPSYIAQMPCQAPFYQNSLDSAGLSSLLNRNNAFSSSIIPLPNGLCHNSASSMHAPYAPFGSNGGRITDPCLRSTPSNLFDQSGQSGRPSPANGFLNVVSSTYKGSSPILQSLPPGASPTSNGCAMGALKGCSIGAAALNGCSFGTMNGCTPQNGMIANLPPCHQNGNSIHFGERSFRKSSPLSNLDALLNDSRLLEDFRAGRLPNLQLRDLVNHVIDFAQDQYGSRFIQQRLQYATDIEKQMVFNEILPSAHLLTINVFGNYVIQKFFELGTSSQKMQLLEQMRGKILNLTLNMYGCRVVQKALERVEREGQRMIANELTGHILRCVKDQNGNHVVQKVIETLDASQLAFVVLALAGQVVALSTHSYGCRVIQRILERCSEEEKLSILKELIENFQILVVDQYGNYVVQHILQHGSQENRSRIIQAVRGDMIRLSQHKFASNVVEKCVEYATNEERRVLINDIIGKSTSGTVANCPLLLMMKDQYANYVVQKMLELSEADQRKEMMFLIRYHVPTLKRYTYGKHILAKVEKFFQKNSVPTMTDMNGDDKFTAFGVFFSNCST